MYIIISQSNLEIYLFSASDEKTDTKLITERWKLMLAASYLCFKQRLDCMYLFPKVKGSNLSISTKAIASVKTTTITNKILYSPL